MPDQHNQNERIFRGHQLEHRAGSWGPEKLLESVKGVIGPVDEDDEVNW